MKWPRIITLFPLQLVKTGWGRFSLLTLGSGLVLHALLLFYISFSSVAIEVHSGYPPPTTNYYPIHPNSTWAYAARRDALVGYHYLNFWIERPGTRTGKQLKKGTRYLDGQVEGGPALGYRVYGMKVSNSPPVHSTQSIPKPITTSYSNPSFNIPNHHTHFIEDSIGYPFISARSSISYNISTSPSSLYIWDSYQVHQGIHFLGPAEPYFGQITAFPLKPVLPGFILNTLLFSLPLATLILFPRAIRVRRARNRNQSGRCVVCCYPVDNIEMCPECGTRTDIQWLRALWSGKKIKSLQPARSEN